MDNVTDVKVGPLPADSPYMKPFRLHFKQNGKIRNWDLMVAHDSVAVIMFNKTHNTMVFVKQFRPAVYHGLISHEIGNSKEIDTSKYPPSQAITLELCAGIVDKDLPLAEIAREEMEEECGYAVPVERLEEVMKYRSGVGTTGSLQVLYYCEVTDDDKKPGAGGGVDDEMIEVVEMSLKDAWKLVEQGSVHTSPPSFLFGVLWFLTNRAPKDKN